MPFPRLTLACLFAVSACGADETVSGYAGAKDTWRLTELDQVTFRSNATIRFHPKGRITGEGPCNGYAAAQMAPYPWFRAEQILATRRACPDLPDEQRFFDALGEMTLVEVSADVLILSTPGDREMVFAKVQP
jgi:heat shock protein HslJ